MSLQTGAGEAQSFFYSSRKIYVSMMEARRGPSFINDTCTALRLKSAPVLTADDFTAVLHSSRV